jgi:hypothetical protein
MRENNAAARNRDVTEKTHQFIVLVLPFRAAVLLGIEANKCQIKLRKATYRRRV